MARPSMDEMRIRKDRLQSTLNAHFIFDFELIIKEMIDDDLITLQKLITNRMKPGKLGKHFAFLQSIDTEFDRRKRA